MSYTIEVNQNQNTLICTWHEDFDFKTEIDAFIDELTPILDALPTSVYMVNLFIDLKLSFTDIMTGASMATRGEASVFHHDNVKQVIFVTQDRTLSLAAKGLNSFSFGNVDIKVFKTLDEAMDFIRSETA